MVKLIELYEEIKQSQYKIYCDVDGVLANFDKGFQDLTGYLPNNYENKFGTTAFWSVIPQDTPEFWANLEWMPEGKQLWNYIKKYNPTLLTAPSRAKTSKLGKIEWRDKHLPGVKMIFKGAKYKHEYAKPNHILIDDREDNIQRWKDAGGIGIQYLSTQQTINQLKQLGL